METLTSDIFAPLLKYVETANQFSDQRANVNIISNNINKEKGVESLFTSILIPRLQTGFLSRCFR